jgi:predicted RNA binding protein YcfA (HicA-like mRNA interferase family)
MANIKKLIQKMKNQPHGIILEEADRVLRHNGYYCKCQKGSHCQYINSNGDVITILAESPLKKAYIIAILERIGEN